MVVVASSVNAVGAAIELTTITNVVYIFTVFNKLIIV